MPHLSARFECSLEVKGTGDVVSRSFFSTCSLYISFLQEGNIFSGFRTPRNQLILPGNKLLKGPKALTTRKTGTTCEALFWGMWVQSQQALGSQGLDKYSAAWLACDSLRRHCAQLSAHSMQIGPHMVHTMLCTTSSTQVPKASAESGDANLRPATQGSRAEPRHPQSAESQEEDSSWNPGWRVSWALAPFHCCTLCLSHFPLVWATFPGILLASCPPLGSNRDTLVRLRAFQPLLCNWPSGRSRLNVFISRRFSVLISKMGLAPHSCPTLK